MIPGLTHGIFHVKHQPILISGCPRDGTVGDGLPAHALGSPIDGREIVGPDTGSWSTVSHVRRILQEYRPVNISSYRGVFRFPKNPSSVGGNCRIGTGHGAFAAHSTSEETSGERADQIPIVGRMGLVCCGSISCMLVSRPTSTRRHYYVAYVASGVNMTISVVYPKYLQSNGSPYNFRTMGRLMKF